MKQTLLLAAAMVAALCSPQAATAQTETVTTSELQTFRLTADDTDIYGQMDRVAPAGKYAVGTVSSGYIYGAYYWTKASGEATIANESLAFADKNTGVIINDVSDRGLMVGAYVKATTDSEGNTTYAWTPAIKTIGEDWIDLPLPADAYEPGYVCANWRGSDNNIAPQAVSIVTSNGRSILGKVLYKNADDPENGDPHWQPVVWWVYDDENYIDQEFNDITYYGNGFVPVHANTDCIIVGQMETADGHKLPAFIKQGALSYLAHPDGNIEDVTDVSTLTDGATTPDEDYTLATRAFDVEDGTATDDEDDTPQTWEGTAVNIDTKGFIYYYYSDAAGTVHSKKYCSTDNLIINGGVDLVTEYAEGTYVVWGNPNLVLATTDIEWKGGEIVVLENNTDLTDLEEHLAKLGSVTSFSTDGKTIAGSEVEAVTGRNLVTSYYHYPALLTLSQEEQSTGILSPATNNLTINRNGNMLTIDGNYDSASLLNAAGQTIALNANSYDMGALAAGMYIVKVSRNGETATFKVLK